MRSELAATPLVPQDLQRQRNGNGCKWHVSSTSGQSSSSEWCLSSSCSKACESCEVNCVNCQRWNHFSPEHTEYLLHDNGVLHAAAEVYIDTLCDFRMPVGENTSRVARAAHEETEWRYEDLEALMDTIRDNSAICSKHVLAPFPTIHLLSLFSPKFQRSQTFVDLVVQTLQGFRLGTVRPPKLWSSPCWLSNHVKSLF